MKAIIIISVGILVHFNSEAVSPVPPSGELKGASFSTGGTGKNITIKDNRFNNVQQGIVANGTSFDEVSLNVFNIPEGGKFLQAWGVFLFNTYGYLVTENTFSTPWGSSDFTYGAISRNTTLAAGEIYKNEFPGNFRSATQMEQSNDLLQAKCNKYLNSDTDVDWAITSGTLADQGFCDPDDETAPANNTFKPCAGGNESQIYIDSTTTNSGFIYSTQVFPNCYTNTGPNVVTLVGCPGPFNEPTSCPPAIDIPCGPPCLISQRTAFENELPGMRKEVMKSGLIRALLNAGELADVLNILAASNDPKDIKLLVPTFLSFGECQMAEDELLKLPLNTMENIRFRELFDILIGACKNDRNEKELTPGEKVNVRTVSTSPEKVSVHADAVLTIADSTEYFRLAEEIIIGGGSFKKGSFGSIDEDNTGDEVVATRIKAVPNPSNGNVAIWYEFTEGMEMSVYNAIGARVRHFNVLKNNDNIEINNLEHGFYLVVIANNGIPLANQRVIIIK